MEWGYLCKYFRGVGAKRLRAVELDPGVSHQHEFDGVNPFRAILGTDRREVDATILWFPDEEDKREQLDATLTWYDARAEVSHRSAEFRLYYPADAASVVRRGSAGDLVLLALTPDNTGLLLITPEGSTTEQQLLWLFGLPRDLTATTAKPLDEAAAPQLDAVSTQILEALGVETEQEAPDALELLLSEFGHSFPSTAKMSAFARSVENASPSEDPDAALLTWFNREELLFRTLEREIVQERLRQGFTDVDDFMAFSLSVHNRRKSRAGYALENHLAAVFDEHGVRYSRGKVTERTSKPDFIFPGVGEYRQPNFPSASLTMLGVKSTCKDRWRQILPEADRIREKHLATLERGISPAQTEEMRANSVCLVIPRELQESYLPDQQAGLLDVRRFLELVLSRQQ